MRKASKKAIALLLSVIMVLGMAPVGIFASAADGDWVPVHFTEKVNYSALAAGNYAIVDGTRSLNNSGTTLSANNVGTTFANATVWTFTKNGNVFTINSGNYYLRDNSGTLAAATTTGNQRNFTVEAVSTDGVTIKSNTGKYLSYNGTNFVLSAEPKELKLYTVSAGTSSNYVYTLDTDGIDVGSEYLIVTHSQNLAAVAVRDTNAASGYAGGTVSVTKNNNTITLNSGAYDWTFTNATSGYIRWGENNSLYLSPDYGLKIVNSQPSTKFSIARRTNPAGAYAITCDFYGNTVTLGYYWGAQFVLQNAPDNGELYVDLYKLTSSPTASTTATQKTFTETGRENVADLWAMASGSVEVEQGTSKESLNTAVKSDSVLVAQTSTSATGANPVTISGSSAVISVDTASCNTAVAGNYTAPVKYNNIQIGSVAVTVKAAGGQSEFRKLTVQNSKPILEDGTYYFVSDSGSRLVLGSNRDQNGGVSGSDNFSVSNNVLTTNANAKITVTVVDAQNNTYYFQNSSGQYLQIADSTGERNAKFVNTETEVKLTYANGKVCIGNTKGTMYLNRWDNGNNFGVWNAGTNDGNSRFTPYFEVVLGTASLAGTTEYTITEGDTFSINDIIKDTYVLYEKQDGTSNNIKLNGSGVTYGWDSHYGYDSHTGRGNDDLGEGNYKDVLDTTKPGKYFLYVRYNGEIIGRVTVVVEPEEEIKVVPGVEENFRVKVFNYGGAIEGYRDRANDNQSPLDFFEYWCEVIDGRDGNGSSGTPFTTVKKLGSDGNPVIHSNNLNRDISLAYLFDDEMGGTGDTGFVKGNGTATEYNPQVNSDYQSMRFDVKNENGEGSGLFQINENGYYYYDSGLNAAYYNQETRKFELYDYTMVPSQGGAESQNTQQQDIGNFFPFNLAHEQGNVNDINTNGKTQYQLRGPIKFGEEWEDKSAINDVWFGLSVEMDLVMPRDGKVDGKDMTFNFSGDDDLWLYVDDVLVLDMGGCHGVFNGSINFTTGEVTYQNNSTSTWSTTNVSTTIKKCFQDAGVSAEFNGNTLADYSEHTIKIFYMERGGNISDCKMEFNIPTYPPESTIKVSKTSENCNPDETFEFYALDENHTPLSGIEYMVCSSETDEVISNGVTNLDGSFGIKADQYAIFSIDYREQILIKEKKISQNDYHYDTTWSIDGNSCQFNEELETGVLDTHPYETMNVVYNNNRIGIDPIVIVVDYGKTIPSFPLENNTNGFKIAGITDSAPSADVELSDSLKLKNGVAQVASTSHTINVPSGTYITSVGKNETKYIYTNNDSVSETNNTKIERYVISNGHVAKYPANSSTASLSRNVSDNKYISDGSYVFCNLNGEIHVSKNYETKQILTYKDSMSKVLSKDSNNYTYICDLPNGEELYGFCDSNYYLNLYYGSNKNNAIAVVDKTIRTVTFNVPLSDGSGSFEITAYRDETVNNNQIFLSCQVDETNGKGFVVKTNQLVMQDYVVTDKENNSVIYSPFQYMSSIDRLYYYVDDVNSVASTNRLYSTVTFIPATTVYYEDDFGGTEENGGLYIKYTGDWFTVSDDGSKASGVVANTDTSVDVRNRQDRGEVGDGHTPYGYDSSYDGNLKFSNGTAAVAEGKVVNKQFVSTASFTFTGTGFDIISRTDMDCGMITVLVNDHETGEFITSVPVINKGVGTLYQIPVISYTSMPDGKAVAYGTYDVVINISAPISYLGITGSTFYLDAIRIYDPMGKSSSDNEEFDEANAAYNTDKEANAFIASIRDFIIQIGNLGPDENYGAVYVDTINNDYNDGGVIGDIQAPTYTDEQKRWRTMKEEELNTFELVGPNEEVYLTPGKGVGFIVESNLKPESIQLEIKIPSPLKTDAESTLSVVTYGDTSTQKNFVVKSAAEMFYDITDAVKLTQENGVYRATVVLSNGLPNGATANEIVSITNIKMTYADGIKVQSVSPSMVKASASTVPAEPGTLEYAYNAEMEALANCGVAVASLKASSETYKQVFDTVYVQREASTPNYDVVNAEMSESIYDGGYADITFHTSDFVKDVKLLDESGNEIELTNVRAVTDQAKRFSDDFQNAKTWTAKARILKDEGDYAFTVKAVDGEGEAVTMPVTVTPAKLTSLKVESAPAKTEYAYGEEIDASGISLKAVYSNGEEKVITEGITLENTVADKSGEMTVTAEFEGTKTEFTVKVTPVISGIRVGKAPAKTSYKFGSAIDASGLEIIAEYNDGTEKVVSGYTLKDTKADTEGTMKVGVEYEGFETEFNVNVKKTFFQKLVDFFKNIVTSITGIFGKKA